MVAFPLSPGRLSGPIMSLMNMNRGRLANEGLDAKKMLPPRFPWRAEGGGGVELTAGQQEVDIGGARAPNEHGVLILCPQQASAQSHRFKPPEPLFGFTSACPEAQAGEVYLPSALSASVCVSVNTWWITLCQSLFLDLFWKGAGIGSGAVRNWDGDERVWRWSVSTLPDKCD